MMLLGGAEHARCPVFLGHLFLAPPSHTGCIGTSPLSPVHVVVPWWEAGAILLPDKDMTLCAAQDTLRRAIVATFCGCQGSQGVPSLSFLGLLRGPMALD